MAIGQKSLEEATIKDRALYNGKAIPLVDVLCRRFSHALIQDLRRKRAKLARNVIFV